MLARYNFFSRYTIAALLITIIVSVVAAWLIQQRLVGQSLDQEAAAAARQVGNVLDYSLMAKDLNGSMSDIRLGEIDGIVNRNVLPGPVVRVRIVRADGFLLYSESRGQVGETIPVDDEIEAALNGEIVAGTASPEEMGEPTGDKNSGDLLRIYSAVSVDNPDSNEAVYEIYYDLENVAADTTSTLAFIWGVVILGNLLVFAAAFTLGRFGSPAPGVGEGAVERSKLEAKPGGEVVVALYDIARDLARTGPAMDEGLATILKGAVERAHLAFACLFLVQDDKVQRLAAYPERILSSNFITGEATPLSDLPTLGAVVADGEPLLVGTLEMSDLAEEERQALLLDMARTVCVIPVSVEDVIKAVLLLGEVAEGERAVSAVENMELFRGLAELAGDALRRADDSLPDEADQA